ncbi:retroviral-like aspartic protease family protein [Acetobacter sp. P5B1]|uniref:aspartyl protease family protein n=1 Tax=Acetobacter sp. P5B1 TaxID=2762620 RepID=UPI001C050102
MHKSGWIGMVSLLALAGCAEQNGVCQVSTLGDLPVLNKQGSPIVGVTINGHDAAMIVDSGADISMISEEASKNFGLVDTGHVLNISGVTGEMLSPIMQADKMGLGSGTSGEVYLTQAKRSFGGTIAGRPVVGLFGADFLQSYDVMFDLPGGKIALYQLSGCKTPTPTWEGPSSKVDWYRLGTHELRIGTTIRLNGKKIDAMLDSGAWHTSVLPSQARKAGVSKDDLAQDITFTSTGVSGKRRDGSHLHRFASLQIGDELYPNPLLGISPIETNGYALLGADFLRHNRVWVSYRHEQLYIQRLQPPEQDHTFDLRIKPKNAPATGAEPAVPVSAPFPRISLRDPASSGNVPAAASAPAGAPVTAPPVPTP